MSAQPRIGEAVFLMQQPGDAQPSEYVHTHRVHLDFDHKTGEYQVRCYDCGWKWSGKDFDDAGPAHVQYGRERPYRQETRMSTDDVIEQAARVLAGLEPGEDWSTKEHWGALKAWGDVYVKIMANFKDQAQALADAGLLARPLPTRDEIADELSGWPIGTGYYQTTVATDEARDMADAVLELLKGKKS